MLPHRLAPVNDHALSHPLVKRAKEHIDRFQRRRRACDDLILYDIDGASNDFVDVRVVGVAPALCFCAELRPLWLQEFHHDKHQIVRQDRTEGTPLRTKESSHLAT